MTDENEQKFKSIFKSVFKGWDYTELVDTTGFTLRGKYTDKQIKAFKVDGDYEYVPFINFYFNRSKDNQSNGDYTSMVIAVGISMIEYNADGTTRYVLDTSHIKSVLRRPIEIRSSDDYFYNTKTEKFYRKKGKKYIETDLKKIYKEIIRLHVASYFTYTGIRARLKVLLFRTLPLFLLESISKLMGTVVWVINGRFYTFDPFLEEFRKEALGYNRKDSEEKEPKREVDFFGYKVAIWTLFSYPITAIITLIIIQKFYDYIFNWMGSLEIVTVAIAVATIIFYDKIIPHFFVKWIKIFSNKSTQLKFTGVKLNI